MSIGRDYLYSVVKLGVYDALTAIPKTMYVGTAEIELYQQIKDLCNGSEKLPSLGLLLGITQFEGEIFDDLAVLETGVRQRNMELTYTLKIPQISNLVSVGKYSQAASALSGLSESILNQSSKQKAKDLGTLMRELDDRLTERRSLHGVIGIETPWPSLTTAIHGWRKSNTYILAARPKVGKTQALVVSALHSLNLGHKVLFVSMEMSEEEITDRTIAQLLNLSTTNIARGAVSSFLNLRLQELSTKDFTKNFKLVDGAFATTVSDIEALILEEQPDIVFIDGAYLVTIPEMAKEKQWERVAEIFKRIKLLAMRKQIPIVCSYQFNREAGKKGGDVENLQLSDALGQISSALVGMNFVAGNPLQRKMALRSNRHGPLVEVLISWNWIRNNFTELDSDNETIESGFTYEEGAKDPEEDTG